MQSVLKPFATNTIEARLASSPGQHSPSHYILVFIQHVISPQHLSYPSLASCSSNASGHFISVQLSDHNYIHNMYHSQKISSVNKLMSPSISENITVFLFYDIMIWIYVSLILLPSVSGLCFASTQPEEFNIYVSANGNNQSVT